MSTQKGAHVLPLRIAVRHPIPGVALMLQRGRDEIVPPTATSGTLVTFDFPVRVDVPDDYAPLGFHGPLTQGNPQERFVHVCVGKRARHPGSASDRRAKIPLGGITKAHVREMLASCRPAAGGEAALTDPDSSGRSAGIGDLGSAQLPDRTPPHGESMKLDHRIPRLKFSSVYPHYVQRAEKKGRTKAEVDQVIRWLTGYTAAGLEQQVARQTDFETFFAEAPKIHPNAKLITGVICGVRVEEIEDPLVQRVRWLDKVIDELARGKALEKIMR